MQFCVTKCVAVFCYLNATTADFQCHLTFLSLLFISIDLYRLLLPGDCFTNSKPADLLSTT